MDILSVVVGILSVALGIVAIWLSLTFYRFSDEAQRRVLDVAAHLDSSVEALQRHVEGLSQDAFGLVRDTVADLRSSMWARTDDTHAIESVLRARLEEQVAVARAELRRELEQVAGPSLPVGALVNKMESVLRESVEAGLAARQELVRDALIAEISRVAGSGTEAAAVVSAVAQQFPFSEVLSILRSLIVQGAVTAADEVLRPTTLLSLGGEALRTS